MLRNFFARRRRVNTPFTFLVKSPCLVASHHGSEDYIPFAQCKGLYFMNFWNDLFERLTVFKFNSVFYHARQCPKCRVQILTIYKVLQLSHGFIPCWGFDSDRSVFNLNLCNINRNTTLARNIFHHFDCFGTLRQCPLFSLFIDRCIPCVFYFTLVTEGTRGAVAGSRKGK